MKLLTRYALLAALATLAATASVLAQDPAAEAPSQADVDKAIELVRTDVRAQKADIVAKTMELDASQAAAFWPVYKTYEAERTKLGDERLAIIKDYAAHYQTLTDEKAKELLDRSIANQDATRELEKKYVGEMLKVLPAKTVARFFQVEHRLNTVIDLKLASEIPLAY